MSNKKDEYLTHSLSVAEEIKMFMNLETSVKNDCSIEVHTVAGVMNYKCNHDDIMTDVYRFINHYGSRLAKWGLQHKLSTLNTK